MKDVDRDKHDLIQELEQLRQQINQLQASESERLRVLDELRESETRYRALIDNANEIIVVIQDGLCKFANPKTSKFTGYSLEELTLRPFIEFIHPDDREKAADNYVRRLRGEDSALVLPMRILTKSEEIKWIEFSWSKFTWAGNPALLYLINDISDLKKFKDSLSESEGKYRELAESITDLFFAMDSELKFTYWNKAVEDLTGISAEESLGKTIFEIFDISPDDESTRRILNFYRKALATKEPQHTIYESTINGNSSIFDVSAYPTQDGLCVYVKDITEQKKLEIALEESERWYRLVFDNTPIGIGFASVQGKVINVNKAMETITGYSSEEFERINVSDIYVNGADRDAFLHKLKQHGSVIDYLLRLKRKDDSEYDALLTSKLVSIGDKEFVQTMLHDVTESKLAQEKLRESEERYRSLVELSPEAIFVAVDGRHVFTNSAGMKLLGASSADEILGKSVIEVIHPDYRNVVAERMRTSMNTGIPVEAVEEKFIRLDGTEVDVEARAAPLVYRGKPAIQAVVRDISDRKRAEEAFRLSEQNFRLSIENSPLGVRIADAEGVTLYANKAFLTIYGYDSVEELEAVPRKQRYTAQSYDEHHERMRKRRQGDSVPNDYEISIVRKDGQVRHLSVSRGEVLWNGQKQFQVVYQDITERKRADAEMRTKDYALASSISGILLLELDGVVLYVNKAYMDLWGYDNAEQAVGHNLGEIAVNKELAQKLIKQVLTRGEWKGEIESSTRRGAAISALLSASLVKDEKGIPIAIIASVIDITERKQAAEQLQQEKDRAQQYLDVAGVMLIAMDVSGRVRMINRKGCEVLGYEQEDIIGRNWFDTVVPPKLISEVKNVFTKLVTGEVEPVDYFENAVLTKKGDERTIAWHNVILRDSGGKIAGTLSSGEDITERRRAENRVNIQRDLSTQLSSVYDLDQGIKMCLEAALKISNLDCGGLYLMDNRSGDLFLAYSEGLSAKFVKKIAHYGADSINVRLVTAGKPIYSQHSSLGTPLAAAEKDEGLQAIAILPFYFEDQVIGCLNVASHSLYEIPVSVRSALEIITSQIGDVVGRIKSREELLKSEARYRLLAENASDVIWTTDLNLKINYISASCINLYGYTPEEAMNLSFDKVMTRESYERVISMFGKGIADDAAGMVIPGRTRSIETEFICKDGSTIWAETVVTFIRDEAGKPIGVQGVTRNIDERKRAEEAMQASEARYRLLAENVRDVIWSTDMDLKFTYVSPSIKYLQGRTAEEVMTMSLKQLLTPASQELAMKTFAEELAIANGPDVDPNRSRTLEVEFVRRDSSLLWAELKMNFIRAPDGRPVGILGVMRDINERKKAESERREFEQKAQLASHLASVGELASGVAHEINNPLTGVIGYAELLMQEEVPEHVKNDLAVIHDGAQRVAGVVKGLLKFARQTKPERVLANINEIIEVTLRLRAYELETNNIKVVTHLAPALPFTIADPGQLQQVFLNLTINAETEMKLAHGKGKLVIKTEQADNVIRIAFKDNGPGIARKNLKKIFDPFFTTREVGKGTGLGLSICHGIISAHGGKIYAESQLGKGATFIVELPLISEHKQVIKRAKSPVKPKQTKKAKILVVDDEAVVRQLLGELLKKEGYSVEVSADGKDALSRIRKDNHNLILLDIKLPGMSGSEIYKRIHEISVPLSRRVVFITGDVMGADTEAFLAKTKAPYIAKPFNLEHLKEQILRLLIDQDGIRTTETRRPVRKPRKKIKAKR